MPLLETAEILTEPTAPLPAAVPEPSPRLVPVGVVARAEEAWTVETVRSLAGFEALRAEWDELLAASASDRFFLTWDWLYTFWKHLGADRGERELDLVTVRRGDRLAAVAPFFRAPSPRGLLAGRSLQLLGTGTVGSDYLDLIVRVGEETTALALLAQHVEREGVIVELGQLVDSGGRAGALADSLSTRGWTTLERTTNVCPYVDLSGHTWESYVASLGKSHRANVRRRLRKLEDAFDVRFERAESDDDRQEALDLLLALHHDRWRGRGGSDAFGSPAVEAFHREVTRRALERDWLRLFLLRLDGRPAAALYGFRYRDRFLFYQSGFASDFASYSVGLVTMGLSIKAAIEEGLQEYDLLHGDESYKFLWASRSRELTRIELFPPSLEARLRRTVRAAKSRVRGWLQGSSTPAARWLLQRGGER